MASWPGTLPQEMRLPISHSQEDGRLRTKMDAGPVKMRRRYTAVEEVNTKDLKRWLGKSKKIQWDYKNIVKRKGKLERLK